MHRGNDSPDATAQSPSRGGVSGICDSLLAVRSVLLVGAQGFGKSHTADAIVRVLRTRGVDPLRIRGTSSTHAIPFGAVIHSSTLSHTAAVADDHPITAALLLLHATRLAGTGTPVIIVDDAHLLDSATMACLYQLCSERSLALLLTTDPLPSVSTDIADIATIRMLDDLWLKGGADRVDLEPMSAQESSELVREFAPGETFDLITRAQLRRSSGGSRVLLRELTAEAMRQETGPDTRSMDALPPVRVTGRIRDMLGHQLRGLTAGQIALLGLISTVSALSHSRSLMLLERDQLRNLLQTGFLSRSAEGDLLRVNELLGEAALLICDTVRLSELTTRLAHVLLTDRSRGVSTTAAECLLICDDWIEFGDLRSDVLPTWGADTVSDILLIAAGASGATGDASHAVLCSWLATQVRLDMRSTIEHSRALADDRRLPAARASLAGAFALAHTPSDAVQLVQWRLSLAISSSATGAEIADLIAEQSNWFSDDPAMLSELDFARLTLALRDLDWERLAIDGETLARDTHAEIGTRIRSACLSGLGHAHLGHGTEALALLDLARHHNQSGQRHDTPESGPNPLVDLKIFHCEARVRTLTGLDVASVTAELHERIERAVLTHDGASFTVLSMIAVHLARYRGDIDRSETELRRAVAELSRWDPDGWLPMVRCRHAAALAQLGFADAARRTLAQVNALVHPSEQAPYLRHEADQARLAILIFSGNIDSALALARELLAGTAGQDPTVRVDLIQVFLQLGEPAADYLDILAATVADADAPLLLACADQVRAIALRDAVGLDRAAARLAGLGAFARAALASDDAALIHSDRGNRAAATVSRGRTDGYAAAASGRPAPKTDQDNAARTLTGREKQVTALATQGLSNRDIAAALFLSVRTVESHLYKARAKTGAKSRGDDAVASVPVG